MHRSDPELLMSAAGHNASVQMIDTSIVRVHQHGACIADKISKIWVAHEVA